MRTMSSRSKGRETGRRYNEMGDKTGRLKIKVGSGAYVGSNCGTARVQGGGVVRLPARTSFFMHLRDFTISEGSLPITSSVRAQSPCSEALPFLALAVGCATFPCMIGGIVEHGPVSVPQWDPGYTERYITRRATW